MGSLILPTGVYNAYIYNAFIYLYNTHTHIYIMLYIYNAIYIYTQKISGSMDWWRRPYFSLNETFDHGTEMLRTSLWSLTSSTEPSLWLHLGISGLQPIFDWLQYDHLWPTCLVLDLWNWRCPYCRWCSHIETQKSVYCIYGISMGKSSSLHQRTSSGTHPTWGVHVFLCLSRSWTKLLTKSANQGGPRLCGLMWFYSWEMRILYKYIYIQ